MKLLTVPNECKVREFLSPCEIEKLCDLMEWTRGGSPGENSPQQLHRCPYLALQSSGSGHCQKSCTLYDVAFED